MDDKLSQPARSSCLKGPMWCQKPDHTTQRRNNHLIMLHASYLFTTRYSRSHLDLTAWGRCPREPNWIPMGSQRQLKTSTLRLVVVTPKNVIPQARDRKAETHKHSRAPYSLPNKSKRAGTHVPKRGERSRVMHGWLRAFRGRPEHRSTAWEEQASLLICGGRKKVPQLFLWRHVNARKWTEAWIQDTEMTPVKQKQYHLCF